LFESNGKLKFPYVFTLSCRGNQLGYMQMITISGIYNLVICEKPAAARRLAAILGDKSIRAINTRSRVPMFDIESKSREHYVICSALGHLYNLIPLEKNRRTYPVFDLKWSPRRFASSKHWTRIDLILAEISEVSKRASGFIHACDYDIEGELIGYNILQYACKNKYAKSRRARFSTLTDSDIKKAFGNLIEPEVRLANAGKTRHNLDFVFGINLSRALSHCLLNHRDYKRYTNITIGRVQGPTLFLVVKREIEIKSHVPEPYWNVLADFSKSGKIIRATYLPKTIESLAKATDVLNECREQDGVVKDISIKDRPVIAPPPFDLSELQKNAYRIFRITPSMTLSVAESLYLAALISYPRTSSQRLPKSIGYKEILSKLSSNYGKYRENANSLINKENLLPTNGPKDDPAHPAIYPTGEKSNKLNTLETKIYDLIVKRIMAAFGPPAIWQDSSIMFDVKGHSFIAEGRKLVQEGWIKFYEPYFHVSESFLPQAIKGDAVKVQKIWRVEKFTQAPPRYNQATLLEAMERNGLGTKSTRAEIMSTLIKRNYVSQGKTGFEATELGFALIKVMERYIPSAISTDLTKTFEKDLEKIESGKIKDHDVTEKAVKTLRSVIERFRTNASTIGEELTVAVERTTRNNLALGMCPLCHKGSLLIIRSSKTRKRFIVCSQYRISGCKASAPLPQIGKLLIDKEPCPKCAWPTMTCFYGREKTWNFCVNTKCESKIENRELKP
jgi:DNA topoisomerase I